MFELHPAYQLLLDIDARQDDVLRQLDELDARLETVLRGCAEFCRAGAPCQRSASAASAASETTAPIIALSLETGAASVSPVQVP